MRSSKKGVRSLIHQLYQRSRLTDLETDPLKFPHCYSDPKDQEIVALISALLAFGNAKAVMSAIASVLSPLGERPWKSLTDLTPLAPLLIPSTTLRAGKERGSQGDEVPKAHRWVSKNDLQNLLELVRRVYARYRSLEELFLEGYHETDRDITPALHHFSQKMKQFAPPGALTRGFRYFFPSPSDGSPCKRLNMFLRWVIRPADGIDLGLWEKIPPSKLIVPLDTHIYQFARRFRLTQIKSPSWKMAVEVTEFLKMLDPDDPVKYDFTICHYGMEKGW